MLLASKVFLEGPYDAAGGKMNTHLTAGNYVPTTEPYTALGYALEVEEERPQRR